MLLKRYFWIGNIADIVAYWKAQALAHKYIFHTVDAYEMYAT